jgi:hypothetical protein
MVPSLITVPAPEFLLPIKLTMHRKATPVETAGRRSICIGPS